MPQYTIAGIGELLWDVFGSEEKLGGAPANFAWHAANLGAQAHIISTVGSDPRGDLAREKLKQAGLTTATIAVDPHHQTGFVKATIDSNGIAHYLFPDDVAWDYLQLTAAARNISDKLDAITFGTLAQRARQSRALIHSLLAELPQKCLRIYDINLRQNFYNRNIIESSMQLADIIKLNEEELPVLTKLFSLNGNKETQLKTLLAKYRLKLAILTFGGEGSLLVTPTEKDRHPGMKTKIVDTVGAGDSFTAAAIIDFMKGRSLAEINDHANHVAAFVCEHQGAMVKLPDYLAR